MKWLEWSNGSEWGEIFCPMLGQSVMTYWQTGTPCYDSYTAPFVDDDGDVCCYRYDHDEGGWHEDLIVLGQHEGEQTCKFA